jgi:hypothetical protein
MTFESIEADLKPILKENQAARCDDMALYSYYCYRKLEKANADTGAAWLQRVFTDHHFRTNYGIAPYESVSRIRRLLQAKYEDLRPDEVYKAERKRAELEYRAYVKKGART